MTMEVMTENENAEAGPSTPVYPLPPAYHFVAETPPNTLWSLRAEELEAEVENNIWRSARWCPDGSCLLTTTEDRTIRLYDTPSNGDETLPTARSVELADSIVSTQWYPFASTSSPEMFCFAAAIRDAPVRLIDAGTGKTRAAYPIVDHRERFIAPHSMAFNPSGTRLYCGHENSIEIIDISSPGYDSSDRLKTSSTKGDKSGQKGIISSLSFSSDYQSGIFAAGSFRGNVSLYAEDTVGAVGHLDGVVGGGITSLVFHPTQSHLLFVGSRRSEYLQVWDIRDTSQPLCRLERLARTNQRLQVDVDPWGRWLVAGDDTGKVRVWDISSAVDIEPIWEAQLHKDAVSSIQFHPYRPILMTTAGSRALPVFDNDEDNESDTDSSSSESENSDSETGSTDLASLSRVPKNLVAESTLRKQEPRDNRLCFWDMSKPLDQSNI